MHFKQFGLKHDTTFIFWQRPKTNCTLREAYAYRKLLNRYISNPEAICVISLALISNNDSSLLNNVFAHFPQPKEILIEDLNAFLSRKGNDHELDKNKQVDQILAFINGTISDMTQLDTQPNTANIASKATIRPSSQ